jgi:hypothetical protein
MPAAAASLSSVSVAIAFVSMQAFLRVLVERFSVAFPLPCSAHLHSFAAGVYSSIPVGASSGSFFLNCCSGFHVFVSAV